MADEFASDEEDLKHAEESVKLAEGILHFTRSNEKLINLVAKLVNTYGIKDVEIRAELQRAFNEYQSGKALLEEIGVFERIQ